jgi:low temperature requirement protein LtrA
LLRTRAPHQHHRVTYVELFFDLVFVFAITQISHTMLAHFTPLGVLQTTILFLAVWWVWIFTSWITNWLDPERTPIRVMLFGLMIAGLLLSTSIPKAFERGLAFAFAFVHAGRALGIHILVDPKSQPGLRMNLLRITFWLAFSGIFWIAGGLAEGQTRLICGSSPLRSNTADLWRASGAPVLARRRWRTGRLRAATWPSAVPVHHHRAWRIHCCHRGHLRGGGMGRAHDFRLCCRLMGSIAMWWVYFHIGAEAGAEHISQSGDTGRLARLAYTYIHLPIVAGIVVSAVGDELVLAHPAGHTDAKAILSIIGGPLLFLIGTILFKRSIRGIFQLSHLVGIGMLIMLIPFAHSLSPLLLSAATTIIMLMVAAWEAMSLGSSAKAEV